MDDAKDAVSNRHLLLRRAFSCGNGGECPAEKPRIDNKGLVVLNQPRLLVRRQCHQDAEDFVEQRLRFGVVAQPLQGLDRGFDLDGDTRCHFGRNPFGNADFRQGFLDGRGVAQVDLPLVLLRVDAACQVRHNLRVGRLSADQHADFQELAVAQVLLGLVAGFNFGVSRRLHDTGGLGPVESAAFGGCRIQRQRGARDFLAGLFGGLLRGFDPRQLCQQIGRLFDRFLGFNFCFRHNYAPFLCGLWFVVCGFTYDNNIPRIQWAVKLFVECRKRAALAPANLALRVSDEVVIGLAVPASSAFFCLRFRHIISSATSRSKRSRHCTRRSSAWSRLPSSGIPR